MQNERRFAFVSLDFPADTFQVVRFNGEQGLSKWYKFEIELISREKNLNLENILQSLVQFKIFRKDSVVLYNGILEEFDQLHFYGEYTFYRAVLVPRLWWLSQIYHNQVFLNKNVPEILKKILKDGGLLDIDFEFRVQEDYESLEYVCQYNETHLNFFQRWLAREGMYYFFEQGESSEKLIITDTMMGHNVFSEGSELTYAQPSGLDNIHREEVVHGFYCKQKRMPQKLRLRNYDYEKPSSVLEGEYEITENGWGTIYQYGEHFKNTSEGKRLAKIKAEALKCREKIFKGQSTVPYIRPGYFFDLKNHYREDFNKRYLVINTYHEGSQAAYLINGLSIDLRGVEKENYYRNEFEAIDAGLQFRSEEYKEKPKFYGFLNAKIDAEGSGEYAEIDDQGRYKVVLPFDISGAEEGKRSAPLRMMQPYAGQREGMYFPLRKGTEVLLAFIDGDPDRPVIAGAVPNIETPSIVNKENNILGGVKTAGGNQLSFCDRDGHKCVSISTPSPSIKKDEVVKEKAAILCRSDFFGEEILTKSWDLTSLTGNSQFDITFQRGAVGSFIDLVCFPLLQVSLGMLVNEKINAILKGQRLNGADNIEDAKSLTSDILMRTIVPFYLTVFSYLAKDTLKKSKLRVKLPYGVSERITFSFKEALVAKLIRSSKLAIFNIDNEKRMLTAPVFPTAYGITLLSSCPRHAEGLMGKVKNFVKDSTRPTNINTVKLEESTPNILLCAKKGVIDVLADDGINMWTPENISMNAQNIFTYTTKNITNTAHGDIILNRVDKVDKYKESYLTLLEKEISLTQKNGVKGVQNAIDMYFSENKKGRMEIFSRGEINISTNYSTEPDLKVDFIKLGKGNLGIEVNKSITNKAEDTIKLVAKKNIELKCGDSSLILKKDGSIVLKCKKFTVRSSNSIAMRAKGTLKIRGKNTTIKSNTKIS
ncbi:Rhs element Vgr protein [Desulfonauticus submarinus]|uniref:Rhs element Vgr protein n=1 Tax=Desulfonauticus submarinus TaxID=206665 RepID=A0A1G9ZWX4_9BACT|nr:type VI secretion system tip protein TssI/VgrG [Desulfonauticus submarinus]SDN25203.1 Rhs element Vgr protein [Desulfonauticus submarinus]